MLSIMAAAMLMGTAQTTERKQPTFMLLLLENEKYEPAAKGTSRVPEYTAWAQELAKKGQLVDGAELKHAGTVLSGKSRRDAVANELPGGKPGGVAGYFVIQAPDLEAALKISSTCPHLKYGGQIMVRELNQGSAQ